MILIGKNFFEACRILTCTEKAVMNYWDFKCKQGFAVYITYCKRWYFRGINFSRLAAQKHIRGLLNSRWADAHLSFLYCTINIIQWMIHIYKYLCNWAAQKQADLRQTWVYYPFASTHMVNTQLLHVQNVPNVHTKYRKYFRGFLNSRLLKNREIREN